VGLLACTAACWWILASPLGPWWSGHFTNCSRLHQQPQMGCRGRRASMHNCSTAHTPQLLINGVLVLLASHNIIKPA
jgi:hypothetical protein